MGNFSNAAQKKDFVVFSLLSLCGGMALDISSIVLQDKLNETWESFQAAAGKEVDEYDLDGGWYKSKNEFTPVWFLLAKQGSKVYKEYAKRALQSIQNGAANSNDYHSMGKTILDPLMIPIRRREEDAVVPSSEVWWIGHASEGPQINEVCWDAPPAGKYGFGALPAV